MKGILFLFCLCFTIGCSTTQLDKRITKSPILLEQNELPPIPESLQKSRYRFEIKMFIDEEGKVLSAKFMRGSGDQNWDSLAVKSIKKWKFDPARYENKPVKMWVIQSVVISIEDPFYLSLAEIVCDSLDDANKIISQLKEGKDFNQLAIYYSSDSSKGILGKKNVHMYPYNIHRILKKLELGEYTEPIEYGQRFVIFKRIDY